MRIEDDWPRSVAEAQTEFENADGETVSVGVFAFRDSVDAQHDSDTLARFYTDCYDQMQVYFFDYLRQAATNDGVEFSNEPVELVRIDVRSEAEWTYALHGRVAWNFGGVPIELIGDTIFVRSGRLTAEISYDYEVSPDEALRDGIVETVAARLAAEDAKLPS